MAKEVLKAIHSYLSDSLYQCQQAEVENEANNATKTATKARPDLLIKCLSAHVLCMTLKKGKLITTMTNHKRGCDISSTFSLFIKGLDINQARTRKQDKKYAFNH